MRSFIISKKRLRFLLSLHLIFTPKGFAQIAINKLMDRQKNGCPGSLRFFNCTFFIFVLTFAEVLIKLYGSYSTNLDSVIGHNETKMWKQNVLMYILRVGPGTVPGQSQEISPLDGPGTVLRRSRGICMSVTRACRTP